ncbi:MAG TPA: sigma-70 family RNA polymerase sigma factor [Marmoricola sp.]|jgi:RNA polymerase sigma factor (sigma-70 family)|nr:sigma-70 family RNA polymerase sigma factor [Marmoricola sp.]
MQPTIDAPGVTYETATDHVLTARGRAGDRQALAEIYQRHYPAVVSAARRFAGPSLGEDLAAEAFARTFSHLLRGAGPDSSVRGYLLAAARNVYVGMVRKDQRITFTDDIADYEQHQRSTDPWDRRYDGQLVMAALSSLPERDKTVLWWLTVEGRPAEELADAWGTSPGAIRQQALRARNQLRLAYLSELTAPPRGVECREPVRLLPRYARGLLNADSPRARKVTAHLATCTDCSAAADELRAGAARLAGAARARVSA